jgi:hypothetical protein
VFSALTKAKAEFLARKSKHDEEQYSVDTKKLTDGKFRLQELDTLIQNIYEDKVRGKVSEDVAMKLIAKYEAEQKELGWYPVWFETPDEMVWISKWVMDDNPGYYASRAVPTQNMIMVLYYEATFDGGWYMKNGKKFADMPSIPTTVNPKAALEAAIDALKAANLNGFVDEMVNRFMMIDKAADGRSIEQQQFSVVLDYVSFKNPDEPADEYPDEPDDGDHVVDPGEPMEPNPDLPF